MLPEAEPPAKGLQELSNRMVSVHKPAHGESPGHADSYQRIMKENGPSRNQLVVQKRGPSLRDFNIPESQKEWDSIIKKMNECEMDSTTVAGIRKAKFNDEACNKMEN